MSKFMLGYGFMLPILFLSQPAWSQTFALAPGQTAIGAVDDYKTEPKQTLVALARTYDLGFTQMALSNRTLDPWQPGVGTKIVIPSFYILPDGPRRGIVVNLAAQRIFYYPPGGKSVETFPIGTGVIGRGTPATTTQVVAKQVHPTWYVPKSIRAEDPSLPAVVPPGPDNPLGDYALLLGIPGYLIHDTNRPYGVGRNVSHGCMHLYPEDIKKLFRQVKVGTPVRIIDEPVEATWVNGDLYVSVFPSKSQVDEVDLNQKIKPAAPSDLVTQILKVAGQKAARIDWDKVEEAAWQRSGIPVRVTKSKTVAAN